MFSIECRIDAGRISELMQQRDRHLEYVRKNLSRLRYGGIAKSPDGELESIIYFVDVPELAEAESFVQSDPYNPFYGKTTIRAFVQRIPGDLEEDGS